MILSLNFTLINILGFTSGFNSLIEIFPKCKILHLIQQIYFEMVAESTDFKSSHKKINIKNLLKLLHVEIENKEIYCLSEIN
jgi:hypothetical protein